MNEQKPERNEPKGSRDEVAELMIELSEDAAKREAFTRDREAFLAGSSLSEEAKRIVRTANQRFILSVLAQRRIPLVAVFVLETITTEVIVEVIVSPERA